MRGGLLALLGSLIVLLLTPTAAAQSEAERQDACLWPDLEVVCDAAVNARFGDMFPGFGDLVLIILVDLAVVALLALMIKVITSARPFPILRFKAAERVKEVEPGGTVRFSFALENLRSKAPVDIMLERPHLPGYWEAELEARREHESGFLIPRALVDDEETVMHLSSRKQGGDSAQVDLAIKAPADTQFEETLDYSLRAVPMIGGRMRKGKAKTSKVTVLVSPSVPTVEIMDVKHEPERIVPGVPVASQVSVKNKGEKEADGTRVVFYLNGNVVATKSLPRLAGGAEETITFDWTPAPGENRVRLAVQ